MQYAIPSTLSCTGKNQCLNQQLKVMVSKLFPFLLWNLACISNSVWKPVVHVSVSEDCLSNRLPNRQSSAVCITDVTLTRDVCAAAFECCSRTTQWISASVFPIRKSRILSVLSKEIFLDINSFVRTQLNWPLLFLYNYYIITRPFLRKTNKLGYLYWHFL